MKVIFMLPKYKNQALHSGDGFFECNIEELQDFFAILNDNNNFQGFLFRGQEFKSYNLEPTILRSYRGERVNVEEYQIYIEKHYRNFISALRGRFSEPFNAERDKYEIWALGQHFGLNTPMLDWTASPWVALYFAFRQDRFVKIGKTDSKKEIQKKVDSFPEDRAVYFLNAKKVIEGYYFQIRHYFLDCHNNNSISYPSRSIGEYDNRLLESVKSKSIDSARKIIDVYEQYGENIVGISDYTKKCCEYAIRKVNNYFPQVISPIKGFNTRLVNQRGLFTYSPTPDSLEKELMTIWQNMEHKDNTLLIKLLIPNKLRETILEALYEMNINDLSLYPDIQGACTYANWKLNRNE
jgi:hypothetical protein